MLTIRICEESFVDDILNGIIRCPVHLYSGEEAIAVGIGAALEKKDYILGGHRSHGHYLAKGGDLRELVSEIYTREAGCSRGRGGSMHLVDPEKGMLGSAPIVAGTISLALGAALASSIRKDGRVTISFFGDGATGEGVLYESLNFAALKKLPIIFVCENNLYSTHMHISHIRVSDRIFEVGKPFGIPSFQVDGNDVIRVYEQAKAAVDHCRSGKGPVFLEFLTYRFRGHVGPDDNIQGKHTDIRPKKEINNWLLKDPIVLFENYLRKNHVIDEKKSEQFKKQIESKVAEAHAYASASANPHPGDIDFYVYS